MVQFANTREEERLALTGSEKAASQANDRDFLSRFLAALEKDPSIPPWQVPRFLFYSQTRFRTSTTFAIVVFTNRSR